MFTQWRLGMGGAVGMDYTAIKPVASMIGIKRDELSQAFADLRAMEVEALLVMRESR